jgi:transglutaminase-like putative cysteine protease
MWLPRSNAWSRRARRSRALTACIATAFVLGAVPLPVGAVNAPDWVRQAAARPLGAYPPETNAVVLLDQTDYHILGSGEYVEHSRHVIKILRPAGENERKIGVGLGGNEKLQFLHAWTIDSAGHEYEIKQKDFIETAEYPNWILYADFRAFEAPAPAPLPGSVIALEYEVRRHDWINELGWLFQDANPVLETTLSVELPPGWEFRTAWTHGSAVEPVKTAANTWQWTLKDLPGVEEDREPMMPSYLSLAGRMSLSYFSPGEKAPTAASWRDVGLWYASLTQGRYEANPDISAKVQQLIAGKTDFAGRLEALTSFLQSEIRYVEISIGIGGAQPHPASDVFRYRYGDCKDKVTLLKAMLHQAGINSEYVLIDTRRGFINPDVPSSWGDHAIIAIELPQNTGANLYPSVVTAKTGKRYVIFDPTDEYTPVGLLRPELQNSYALLVTEAGGELIRTPLLPPASNTIERAGNFVLSADGALTGEVSESQGGDFAARERGRLHNLDSRELTEYIERYVGRSLQGFSIEGMRIEQADQPQKDVLIKFKLSLPQYGQQRGPLMLVRPRVLGEEGEYVEHKPRHYPVELGHTAKEIDTYEIEIPPGYTVDDVPDPAKVDVGFASYASKIEVQGSKLRYWREYVVRDLSIPPERFGDWVKLQGVIGADETAAVVLKRVP